MVFFGSDGRGRGKRRSHRSESGYGKNHTADAGEGLTAVCTVTVTDVYELIFPALPEFVFVGEEIDLGLVLRQNGQEAKRRRSGDTGNGFDVSDGTITPRESGMLNITVTYRDQKQEQSVAAYIEVADAEDLAAVNDGLSDWYKLTADIDFEGGKVETIAHYSDGNSSASSGFLGVFDGNGYSIMNFTPVYKGGIGWQLRAVRLDWRERRVVRNLNVLKREHRRENFGPGLSTPITRSRGETVS